MLLENHRAAVGAHLGTDAQPAKNGTAATGIRTGWRSVMRLQGSFRLRPRRMRERR